MKKILAIGNSFSEDATTYLYDMAKADGIEIKTVNLYIGGCSLETHYQNIQNDSKSYRYDLNGKAGETYVSVKDALLEEDWDVITIQQASNFSGLEETYYPFADELVKYIKKYAENAKIMVHQTWAYEIDSTHAGFVNYDKNQEKMYQAIKKANENLAKKINAEIITCGDTIQKLRSLPEFDYEKKGLSLCIDGYHMSHPYGRYATAATWYKKLFSANLAQNSFVPNGDCQQKLLDIIKENI